MGHLQAPPPASPQAGGLCIVHSQTMFSWRLLWWQQRVRLDRQRPMVSHCGCRPSLRMLLRQQWQCSLIIYAIASFFELS